MKRMVTLLLTAALCMGLAAPAGAAGTPTFTDVPASHWAYSDVESCAEKGIVNGVGEGRFNPGGEVKRAEFCAMLARTFFPEEVEACTAQAAGKPWYWAVMTAVCNKNLNPVPNPAAEAANGWVNVANDRLTRYEMTEIMYNLLPWSSDDGIDYFGNAAAKLRDWNGISANYRLPVSVCVYYGVINGLDTGDFAGSHTMTRAQACAVMTRLMEKAASGGSTAPGSTTVPGKQGGITTVATAMEERQDYRLTRSSSLHVLENQDQLSLLLIRDTASEDGGIWVERYNPDGTSAGVTQIPVELSYCAGFYEGADAYYLAFGQNNREEDDSKEVYRVVRYDKNWNRVGAASVNGGESYTIQPYRSTASTSMAEENGLLILHTARLRYRSDDGLNHQSNITIKIRTSDMSVQEVSKPFPSNHVSHSFAQYVAFDQGRPVYADHGDAYPRGFALNVDNGQGSCREMNFFPFSGAIGDNTTNAIPGGLGVGADNYLFAGASSPQKGNDSIRYCNAFLTVIPKDGFPDCQPETLWLTSLPANGEEYVYSIWMVPMNNNTFVVLWQTVKRNNDIGDFCYAVFDGEGNQVGRTTVVPGYYAPGDQPTVVGNRILWARSEQIPYNEYPENAKYLKIYELEISPNAEAQEETASLRITATPSTLTVGERGRLTAAPSANAAGAQVTYTCEDYSVLGVDRDGIIYTYGPGTAVITGSMTWRGKTYTAETTVTVTEKKQEAPTTPGGSTTTRPGGSTTTPGGSTTTPGGGTTTPGGSTTTRPGGSTTTPGGSTATPGGSTTTPGGGSTTRPTYNPLTSTDLPADGRVNYYREDWGDGNYLELEVVDGDTIRFSGCIPNLASYYNYAVLRVLGTTSDTPIAPNVPFSVEVEVDIDRLEELYGGDVSKSTSYIICMLCQNYKPGDSNLGGFSFQGGSRITIALDGEGGCTIQVVKRS